MGRPIIDKRGVLRCVRVGARRNRPAILTRRRAACVLCFALATSILVAGIPSLTRDASAYTTRQEISIAGNAGFTNASGVTSGSGAALDPYIISGWEIHPDSGDGIRISGTTAYFVITGVYVQGTGSYDGISIVGVTNGAIRDSVLTYNYEGIYLESSSNIEIDNCSIQLNDDCGVDCYSGSHISIANSTMDTNSYGFYADSDVHNITIVNCSMSLNGDGGLYFYGEVTDCIIEGCAVDENQYYEGVYIGGYCYRTRIADCSVSLNYASGIYLYDYAFDLVVHNNTVSSNDGYGIFVYGGDRIHITDNVVNYSYDRGVYLGYMDSEGLCRVSGNDVIGNDYGGIEVEGQIQTVLSNNTIEGSPNDGLRFDGSQCSIENNTIRNNYDFGLLVSSGSPDNLFANNTFEGNGMFVDFTGSEGNTITGNTVNGKPLVYLDGVSGSVVGEAGQVIALNSNGVSVEDKEFSNCSVALELWNCDGWLVENVTSLDNYYGVFMRTSSTDNFIGNSTFVGGEIGISLLSSCSDNVIRGTNMSSNDWIGVFFDSLCNDCTVVDCVAKDNLGSGVRANWCSGIEILDSDLTGNGYASVWTAQSQCRVDGCALGGSSYGFVSSSGTNSVIANNTIAGSGFGTGIMLFSGCLNNLVFNNTVSFCSYGIAVDGGDATVVICKDNRVLNNTVTSCTGYGIYLDGAEKNVVANNTIAGNAYGLFLVGTGVYYNWIYLNNFTGNTVNAQSFSAALVNYWNTSTPVTYWYMGSQYSGYLGNYWDDYAGNDADGNGVGDTPYTFTNGQDNYPLMTEGSAYIPEFPALVVPTISLLLIVIAACGVARSRRSPTIR